MGKKKGGRRSRRKPNLATVAFYGPDDGTATKMVISIFRGKKIVQMKKWYSETDMRSDPEIEQEIKDFMDQHRPDQTVIADRIIGCPHEEGIDYPEGQVCPECPFWDDRDRWTGGKLSVV